jgi:phenylpyruvate tautomerase PptA (4-oxalocrotonate tautomerase family)
MPLVRIDLLTGKSAEYRKQLGQIVYRAMLDTLNMPKDDRFQIIAEHSTEGLQFDLIDVPKENWSFGNGIAQYAGDATAKNPATSSTK